MSKARVVFPANVLIKRRDSELTKRQALALAFRRLTIRQQAAEEKERARSEAKSEARHLRTLARRERTNSLAADRVKACQRFLSLHAVEQLAAIAENPILAPALRVEAANEILRIGYGLGSDLPET